MAKALIDGRPAGQHAPDGLKVQAQPEFRPVGSRIEGPVLLKTGDNISIDEILPADTVLPDGPGRIPDIARHTFEHLDHDFYQRAASNARHEGFVVGSANYGCGSGGDPAAMAVAYLGVHCVIAKSFGSDHRRDLIRFGVIPLLFASDDDAAAVAELDLLRIDAPLRQIGGGRTVRLENLSRHFSIPLHHDISRQELETLRAGRR